MALLGIETLELEGEGGWAVRFGVGDDAQELSPLSQRAALQIADMLRLKVALDRGVAPADVALSQPLAAYEDRLAALAAQPMEAVMDELADLAEEEADEVEGPALAAGAAVPAGPAAGAGGGGGGEESGGRAATDGGSAVSGVRGGQLAEVGQQAGGPPGPAGGAQQGHAPRQAGHKPEASSDQTDVHVHEAAGEAAGGQQAQQGMQQPAQQAQQPQAEPATQQAQQAAQQAPEQAKPQGAPQPARPKPPAAPAGSQQKQPAKPKPAPAAPAASQQKLQAKPKPAGTHQPKPPGIQLQKLQPAGSQQAKTKPVPAASQQKAQPVASQQQQPAASQQQPAGSQRDLRVTRAAADAAQRREEEDERLARRLQQELLAEERRASRQRRVAAPAEGSLHEDGAGLGRGSSWGSLIRRQQSLQQGQQGGGSGQAPPRSGLVRIKREGDGQEGVEEGAADSEDGGDDGEEGEDANLIDFQGVVPIRAGEELVWRARISVTLNSQDGPAQQGTRHHALLVCECGTQGEAAAARDLALLWREQRLGYPSGDVTWQPEEYNFELNSYHARTDVAPRLARCATLGALRDLLGELCQAGTLAELAAELARNPFGLVVHDPPLEPLTEELLAEMRQLDWRGVQGYGQGTSLRPWRATVPLPRQGGRAEAALGTFHTRVQAAAVHDMGVAWRELKKLAPAGRLDQADLNFPLAGYQQDVLWRLIMQADTENDLRILFKKARDCGHLHALATSQQRHQAAVDKAAAAAPKPKPAGAGQSPARPSVSARPAAPPTQAKARPGLASPSMTAPMRGPAAPPAIVGIGGGKKRALAAPSASVGGVGGGGKKRALPAPSASVGGVGVGGKKRASPAAHASCAESAGKSGGGAGAGTPAGSRPLKRARQEGNQGFAVPAPPASGRAAGAAGPAASGRAAGGAARAGASPPAASAAASPAAASPAAASPAAASPSPAAGAGAGPDFISMMAGLTAAAKGDDARSTGLTMKLLGTYVVALQDKSQADQNRELECLQLWLQEQLWAPLAATMGATVKRAGL